MDQELFGQKIEFKIWDDLSDPELPSRFFIRGWEGKYLPGSTGDNVFRIGKVEFTKPGFRPIHIPVTHEYMARYAPTMLMEDFARLVAIHEAEQRTAAGSALDLTIGEISIKNTITKVMEAAKGPEPLPPSKQDDYGPEAEEEGEWEI